MTLTMIIGYPDSFMLKWTEWSIHAFIIPKGAKMFGFNFYRKLSKYGLSRRLFWLGSGIRVSQSLFEKC